MSHEVPIGVTQASAGFIGNSGTSQLIYWVNIIATDTPANVTLFQYTGATTAGNTIAVVDTGATENMTTTVNFYPNLLADNGCYALTSANCSIVNIGYRGYSG